MTFFKRMNMKNFRIILALIGIMLFMAYCKKKEITPPTVSGAPLFYFNGTINGSPTNIQAGVNDYYMFTSYTLDSNGIYDYTGELKPSTCTSNCPSSLKIYIKDYRKYATAPTDIDSTLTPGYYSFATPAGKPSQFSIQFYDTLYNGTASTYAWNFGDNNLSTQHKPPHVYLHPGAYYVSLNTQSTTACSSSITNEIVFGQTGNLVQLSFAPSSVGDTLKLASTVGGLSPFKYHWDFGDGHTADTAAPVYKHVYAAPGVYQIALTRTDAIDTVEVARRNFPIAPVTSCYNYFTPNLPTPLANPMNMADVKIEWRDAAGNLYTTYNNSQPFNSMFKIVSVTNYKNNNSGQPTKMIHARVTCTLYNGSSSTLFTGDITFSVAYL